MSCILDHSQYYQSSANTDVDPLFFTWLLLLYKYTNECDISSIHHLPRRNGRSNSGILFCSFHIWAIGLAYSTLDSRNILITLTAHCNNFFSLGPCNINFATTVYRIIYKICLGF